MPNLLVIDSSPRREYSTSRKLTAAFTDAWTAKHAGGTVVVRDLWKTDLPFVDLPWIGGAYTPPEQHSPEVKAAIKVSDDLIAEIMAADHIVIGTPMYNFSIPAILKAYIDHIVRLGVTFNQNYEGLVHGKTATVIMTSGGQYGPGAYTEAHNVATPYLKQILGFIGITDVTVSMAGGTSAIDQGQKTLAAFTAEFSPEVAAAA